MIGSTTLGKFDRQSEGIHQSMMMVGCLEKMGQNMGFANLVCGNIVLLIKQNQQECM
jgi:hypothetical protein